LVSRSTQVCFAITDELLLLNLWRVTAAEHTGEWADTNLFQPGSLQRHRTADLHKQLQQELTAAAAAHATAAAAAAQHAAAVAAAEAEQTNVAHTLTALTAVAAAAGAALEQARAASVQEVATAQSAAEVCYSCYSYTYASNCCMPKVMIVALM
jgi:hypothetical protein